HQSGFRVRHLPLAAFAAQLAHGFDDVQRAAGSGRLSDVDHAAASLDRQLAFEREIAALVKTHVALGAKAEIFDLQVNHDDVIVVELEEIDIAVFHTGHFHGDFAGVLDAHDQRIRTCARTVRRIASFTEALQVNRFFAQFFGALGRGDDVSAAAVGRHHAV